MTRPIDRTQSDRWKPEPSGPLEAGWFRSKIHGLCSLDSHRWSPDDYVASLSKGEQESRIMRGEATARAAAYKDGIRVGDAGGARIRDDESYPFTVQWLAGWRRGNALRLARNGIGDGVLPVNGMSTQEPNPEQV